ncbi:MAG: ABC transporter ATP-binding protein [Lachnospiraceae bacterium]|nr:ABC transporter ATP-binding protein [Lachnospiraceae bacterium]
MKDFNQLIMRDMCKSFGNLHVLKGFNLTINRGEFVTFLGPSGCGKSTALNCISGLLNITGGSIQVDDEIIDDGGKTFVSPEKRGFGIIFQNYALFPHMTVFDNIAFSLSVAHRPKDEIRRKVEEGIRMVHLEGQEHKFPSQLSGGQQQRVAIARSVVMEPGLLLLDEPLSNLDTKLRTEMRYELKQIHNRLKRASVYVTHDQSEALALSDKIVIMKLGKVQQIGTPKQVFLYPANRFVADFMGYKNIWDAKILSVEESGNIRRFQVESSGIPFMVYSRSGENEEVEKILIQAYQKGEEVLLASRPDDILAGTTGKNDMNIRVEGTEYLGTTIQVTGSIKEGMDVQARIEPNTFVKEGTALSLTIQPDKLLVLPKDKEE